MSTALFLKGSNVFINHSTAPTAKKEHFGPGAQGPARPGCPTSGQQDPPAWSTRPSWEPREASSRRAAELPRSLELHAPGAARAKCSHPCRPTHRQRLHTPAPRSKETKRPIELIPHSAALKAPERGAGRPPGPNERRRAPAQPQDSAQVAAEQGESA